MIICSLSLILSLLWTVLLKAGQDLTPICKTAGRAEVALFFTATWEDRGEISIA